MFSRGKWKNETEINVTLDEPLTNESYTKVVVELIKYVLYQKQQIPCAYDALAQLHTRTKATDKNAIFFKTLSNTLENVSDNLSSQFYIDGCDIKEVAILLGATVLSPKLYIGIELPSCVLDSKQHMEYQHPSRKTLLKLMRSMLECDEFQEAMSAHSGITNTFVMLKKRDANSVSDFFLPKPQYIPPTQSTSCFKIKFCQNAQVEMQCTCRTLVKVYHDSYNTHTKNKDSVRCTESNGSVHSSYEWYQSKQIIKGFKFYS